ncbi:MAG: lipoate--protein ligase [Thermodesulfobacteriota bacterium]
MICIHLENNDPYFNLAAEEYLLKNENDQFFLLWRNSPAIIVGRNQNALAEINEDYVRDNNIPVVRRLSGGGAVFHDLGNINFTLISRTRNQEGINFKKFARPIVKALNKMGVNAEFDGRNDLSINGQKISGNAQHIWKGNTMHHGTLLYNSNVKDLANALRPDELKFQDKAVKSVRKRITNIISHLPEPVGNDEFCARLFTMVSSDLEGSRIAGLSKEQEKRIYLLREDKYTTWSWNFGATPPYTHRKKIRARGGTIELILNVRQGIVQDAHIYGDFFGKHEISHLTDQLVGLRHEKKAIAAVLDGLKLDDFMWQVSTSEFLKLI